MILVIRFNFEERYLKVNGENFVILFFTLFSSCMETGARKGNCNII